MSIPKIKVVNMKSPRTGYPVANQFIIQTDIDPMSGNCNEYFQSYSSIIAYRERFTAGETNRQVYLDINKWDYSVTTGKYRNKFLGETKAQTQKKIDSGIYQLTDLNGGKV